MAARCLSTTTVAAIGLTCKAFLNSGFCTITVNNLAVLLDALSSKHRNKGQGVVTVANHISVLDDPVTWGILPSRLYFNSKTTRWSLGASDIMFTNPIFSAFFRNGQVLETFRGKGVFQPAVDSAIHKLNEGGWVHLFGEGKVNQPNSYPYQAGIVRLPRFKWGVGRILMETAVPPVIIPMWLSGFDKLMPEHRSFPYKFFPKYGVKLSVTFGEPLPPEEITSALQVISGISHKTDTNSAYISGDQKGPSLRCHLGDETNLGGWMGDTATWAEEVPQVELEMGARKQQMEMIRSRATAIVQQAVESLGRKVSGYTLNREMDMLDQGSKT